MCWYIFILFADTYFWHVHLIKIHRLGKVGHLVQGVTLSKILPVIFHIHIFFSVAPVISLSISPSLFHSLVYFFIFMVSSPFTSISLTLLCSQQIQQNDSLSSFFFFALSLPFSSSSPSFSSTSSAVFMSSSFIPLSRPVSFPLTGFSRRLCCSSLTAGSGWSWPAVCASWQPACACPPCPARYRPLQSEFSSWTSHHWTQGKAASHQ